MAKFLNTSGITYHLEELIKNSSDRLILISPYLKLSERIKELLEDKNRLKIDIRIVYGKSELQPEEINWLKNLTFIRTSFCKNLHAKCYLNENECIITSLNLYEFSQINNNEMGVLIYKDQDETLYSDAYEEAQRIIRISEEVRMSLEKVQNDKNKKTYDKLSTSKLAKKLDLTTKELNDKFVEIGYLEKLDDNYILTELGKQNSGEEKTSRFGKYYIWDSDITI
ncbi:MAG: phospholipase D family protein [Gammaproteobacteria bacterium]|nr:phospholipase D family protein [Gammaproteobacteria bacterium]